MIHDGKIILHEDTDVLLSDYALLKVDAEPVSYTHLQLIGTLYNREITLNL